MTLKDWLYSYEACHRHKTNLLIHKICVPLITFHVLAMLDWVTLLQVGGVSVTLAHLLGAAAFGWYLRLSVPYALIMAAFGTACIVAGWFTPWPVVVAIAVGAWAVQLYGHALEQRSPALTQNLMQLLVGPLFVIAVLSGQHTPKPWTAPA